MQPFGDGPILQRANSIKFWWFVPVLPVSRTLRSQRKRKSNFVIDRRVPLNIVKHGDHFLASDEPCISGARRIPWQPSYSGLSVVTSSSCLFKMSCTSCGSCLRSLLAVTIHTLISAGESAITRRCNPTGWRTLCSAPSTRCNLPGCQGVSKDCSVPLGIDLRSKTRRHRACLVDELSFRCRVGRKGRRVFHALMRGPPTRASSCGPPPTHRVSQREGASQSLGFQRFYTMFYMPFLLRGCWSQLHPQ